MAKRNGKLFSLIKGGDVHIAPGDKIIPSESIETVCSSQELLDNVRADAEAYRKEIYAEMEKLKEQAEEEGFARGLEQWGDQLALLEQEKGEIHEKMEKVILPVAMKAAKKIVGEEMVTNPDIIANIVASSLKNVAQHRKIVIYVNKNDLETLEKNKSTLKGLFESLGSLTIHDRADIQPGGCVIETEAGIIDARLENQWLKLEKAFEKTLKQL